MAYIGNVCHLSVLRGFSSTYVYMLKAQWNTVILDGSITQGEISSGEVERMIDNSNMLVVNKMTKKDQQSILVHLE